MSTTAEKVAAQNRQWPYPKYYCSLGGKCQLLHCCIAVTVFRWTRVTLQHSQYSSCLERMYTAILLWHCKGNWMGEWTFSIKTFLQKPGSDSLPESGSQNNLGFLLRRKTVLRARRNLMFWEVTTQLLICTYWGGSRKAVMNENSASGKRRCTMGDTEVLWEERGNSQGRDWGKDFKMRTGHMKIKTWNKAEI